MKKRWLLKLGLLAGLALFGFWFVLWWTATNHRINRQAFDQIEPGMTYEAIVAIFGVAHGEYATLDPHEYRFGFRKILREDRIHFKGWFSNDASIILCFDDNNLLTDVRHASFRGEGSFIDKVRRWFCFS